MLLPVRVTRLETDDPTALAPVQPERGREYVQIRGGRFQGSLAEWSNGGVGFLRESWSCALRVRCARPRGYLAFSAVRTDGGANWCGVALGSRSALEVGREWEIATRGALESLSFAVEESAHERVEVLLAGGDVAAVGNRVLQEPIAGFAADELWRRVSEGLAAGALPPQAQRALQSDFLHFATRLRRGGESSRPESAARRRRVVRTVEDYLDAHEREIPSMADLCAVTGASERTLEYAFREQIGVPPARYLRLRRLNRAREELHAALPQLLRVTDVAMRWGFWHLGRFAVDYQRLFGERPSATLARRPGAGGPADAAGEYRPLKTPSARRVCAGRR